MTSFFPSTHRGPRKGALRLFYAISFLLVILPIPNTDLSGQCTRLLGIQSTVSEDYDDDQGPYTTSIDAVDDALGAILDVTGDATITICFWGDMNGNTETFNVIISGISSVSGDFGFVPSSGSPTCRDFVIPAASIDSDLTADGDIDISYTGFGSGWTPPDTTGGADDFNAQVISASFEFDVPTTISTFSDRCQDGTDITYVGTPADGTATDDNVFFEIFPSTASFNTTTGVLDLSATDPGQYVVRFNYEFNDCTFATDSDIEIFSTPVPTIVDSVLDCGLTGITLTGLFTDATTDDGTFTTTTAGATISGTALSYDNFGCVEVVYTLDNLDGCTGGPFTDTANVFFPENPSPSFEFTSSTSCWDGAAALDITVDRTSPTYTATESITWSATGNNLNVSISNTSADVPTVSVTPATNTTLGSLEICLEETITTTGDCTSDVSCTRVSCNEITISSVGCNTECFEFDPPADVCPTRVNSSFAFAIFGITFDFGGLTGFDLFEASVVPGQFVSPNMPEQGGTEEAVLGCNDDGQTVSWDFALNDGLFEESSLLDDPIIDQIGAGFICDASMFAIPFPDGFCGNCGPRSSPNLCINVLGIRPCILVDEFMPLSFLDFDIGEFGSLCSISPRTLIVDPLQEAIGSSAVGVVWADTDGDGAFDYVVEQGSLIGDGSAQGSGFVPNNVKGEGIITVRHVASSFIAPYSPCVGPDPVNLLDLLPIDFIPVAGPIIRQALTTAGVDINIAPSDNGDLPITVQNDQDPQFLNFPTQYTFSSSTGCTAPVNWSAPVAIDGCTGEIIPDVAQTGGPLPGTMLEIPNPNPVDPANPNLYRVEYTATACNGQTEVQTFDILVSPGTPQLVCPAPLSIKNDVDDCGKVVTGITPLQGLGCNTTVTWTAPGATPSSGTNDASGTFFPIGTTTVTYTMTYVDENGMTQTQTCNFDLTVLDGQAPTVACRDLEVRLDENGSAIVSVIDIDGGSTDNCTDASNLDITLARTDMAFGPSVAFDCFDEGQNTVILNVEDEAGNSRRCLALVTVNDYFEQHTLTMDVPELCLDDNNPEQLEFSNYVTITYPDGTTVNAMEELLNGDDIGGVFGITGYQTSIPGGSTLQGTGPDNPGDAGYIDPVTGVYTPGTGTGFVTISYVIGIGGQVSAGVTNLEGCFMITTDVFELRQPLAMESPECECIVQNDRVVDLGEITGGLEPYTIQYSGVKLDFDNDEIADDENGEFTFADTITGSTGVALVIDITDFTQDLGNLLVDYTQPTWSFTVVDARGCELFRSGSCDNDDLNGDPEIICADLGPVVLDTEKLLCEAQYNWTHPLPTDNCDVILYTYTITNPDGSIAGPFDLTALLNPTITNPLPDQFNGEYEFQHISPTETESIVTYYAEDAVGNFTTCSFTVNVFDDDPPFFLNCPEPAVVVDAIEDQCEAFANYSLPIAGDNCSVPLVTQVDTTGLISGDLYPVGITINTFEAVDATGNTIRCDVKVIINDIFQPPSFDCPDDVATNTDLGDCGAIVNDIAPSNLEDNCIDNVTLLYTITDEDGNEVSSGFDDASGTFFELGTSTVSYAAQDMPLLLITEITHDISDPVDGTEPIPTYAAGNNPTGDYLEITNFNRSVLDISCLTIERFSNGAVDTIAAPTFSLLQPGGTFVVHFGDGTNSLVDNFVNVPGADDLVAADAAAYVISLAGEILDVAVINGYDLTGLPAEGHFTGSIFTDNGAGIIRTTVWDTNSAEDFVPGEACNPTTIGVLNPDLAQPTPNGTQTAIQAQPVERVECAPFTVTVTDDEPAVCGLYGDYTDYEAGPLTIEFGECILGNVITITDDFIVADLNLTLIGTAGDLSNLTVSLISPEGTTIDFIEAICAGNSDIDFTLDGDADAAIEDNCGNLNNGESFVPTGDIEAFNGELVTGDWMVQIGQNGQASQVTANLTSVVLSISPREDYTQADVDLENDPGVCGADFTFFQAVLFDNCPGGTVLEEIIFEDGTILFSEEIGVLSENMEQTFFFPVGTSTVLFTLTDAAGNVSDCGFEVLVRDTEDPMLVCPGDTTIQLASGECEIIYIPTDFTATDNCEVTEIFSVPDFNQPLPIGVHEIDFTIADAAGNDTTCTYTVTVLENIPMPPVMVCISQINVHLGQDCEQEIIPEMVLTGDDFFCFDNYIITLLQENEDGSFDTIPGNVVGIDQIGQNVIYQVLEPRNNITCWGTIEVGFFEAPEFICPADTSISCNALTDTSLLGSPTLLSCALAGATVAFADTLERFGTCDDPRAILFRTWHVTDSYGNAASCVQTITIEAFDLAVVQFPINLDGIDGLPISCVVAANDETATDPINTGFPFVNDGGNIFQTSFCSASFLYSDEVFNLCAGSYEILRTWKVRNTCQPVVPGLNPLEHIQVIRVEEPATPSIICPVDEVISTGPFDCNGSYLIPDPVIEGGCSDYTLTVSASGGVLTQLEDGSYALSGLEVGSYTIQYEVENECGGFNQCIYNISVTDLVDATAICEDGLNVSLGSQGTATITTEDIDGGSNDLCGLVDLSIRRLVNFDAGDCSLLGDPFFTAWGPTVDVNCCDLDSLVTIELQAIDEDGNSSVCWTQVLIEDKLDPICLPPPPVQINCEDLSGNVPANLTEAFFEAPDETTALLNSLFGAPNGIDNCGEITFTQSVVDSRTTCGVGVIMRSFTVTDEQGLFNQIPCTQRIDVLPVHDYTIEFPADRESNDCIEPEFDEITFTDYGCGVITVSTSVDTFLATADECYKLRITYEIINWCEYASEEAPYAIPRDADADNILEESTFLHVYRRAEDDGSDDVALLDRDLDRDNTNFIAFLDIQDIGTTGFPSLGGVQDGTSVIAGYGADPSRGAFRYQQFIKVYDEVAPTIALASAVTEFADLDGDCLVEVNLEVSVTDECTVDDLTVGGQLDAFIEDGNGDGTFTLAEFIPDGGSINAQITDNGDGNFSISLSAIPLGEHAIRFVADDGCGNTDVILVVFTAVDRKAPTPICINGLTATLMPDGEGGGMASIWANDFIASPSTDCSGEVQFALYTSAEVLADSSFVPSPVDTGLFLSCEDLGLLVVRIYAIDPAGQYDYCETTIDVQSFNEAVCDDGSASGSLTGLIQRIDDSPMANVTVNISNSDMGISNQVTTDDQGTFAFTQLPFGEDYTVEPIHNPSVDLAKVTTGDIIMISRHILGLAELEHIYQEIAADVTLDESINVLDIIAVRRVILGLDEGFSNTDSWGLFLIGDETFTRVFNQNNLNENVSSVNFFSIEMGNVTDAHPNGYQHAPLGRNTSELQLPNMTLPAGETLLVRVNGQALAGFQGTIQLTEGVELLDLSYDESTTGFNLDQLASGVFAVSHNGANTGFTIQLRSSVDLELSEAIRLNDRITYTEGYTLSGPTNLRLSFIGNNIAFNEEAQFELLQNVPNPFAEVSQISFLLPEAMPATLKFQDIQGRVIATRTIAGIAGRNVVEISRKDLQNITGVVTYSLIAGEFKASKKMIIQ